MQIKPIKETDLDRVQTLIVPNDNQEFIIDTLGFAPTIDDILRHTKGDPDFDPNLFLGAYIKGELIGSVFALRRPWKQGREQTGFLKWISVKRGFRRCGIGRRLIENCQRKLKKLGCNKFSYGSSAPLYLVPGVPYGDSIMQEFLEKSGWSRQTDRVSLSVNLDEVDIDLQSIKTFLKVNRSVTIGTAGNKQRAPLFTFIEREFSRSWAIETVPALDNAQQAFCCYVADKKSGRILGFSAVNASNPNWFGPMGVQGERRMSGLGGLLVQYSTLLAKERNLKRLMFPWVNETEMFYRKVLGTVGDRHVFLKYEKIIL